MRASIIVNGNYNGTMYITGDLIIAADGGAEELRKRNVLPHVIIGDMDSISEETLDYFENMGAKIQIYPREKDETDLELAIIHAFKHGASEVEILNWQGERVDMILAMIGLLSKYENVTAVSDSCEIGVLRTGENVLKAMPGETWSFLPLCSAQFKLVGFRYAFEGEMHIESPIGVSNEALSNEVRVNVENGKVVYIRWRKKPS